MEVKAFTVKSEGILRQLITSCGVSEPYDPEVDQQEPTINYYNAIWDTGATGTVITAKVASDLGVEHTGFANVGHANGTSTVKTYLLNIYLPNKIAMVGVTVTEGVLGGDIEMLIGMDIICQGDFSVTHVGGKSCFSFRIPSIKNIDYCDKEPEKSSPKIKNKYTNKRR